MSGPCLTIGSLFSGIGALELGLMRAGLGPVLWQAESDDSCRRVLARHFPNARRYEDVGAVDRTAGDVHVVCGGFPCQDLSLAGTGVGLDGKRSGLWRELVRVVREVGPRYVVVENVSALLVRGLGTILGELAEGGFDAAWDCIPAAAVGAPHRRDRLFLVAWRVSDTHLDAVRDGAERGDGSARSADTRDAESRHVGSHGLRERLAVDDRDRREAEAVRRAGDLLADPDGWRREVERIANRQPGDEGAPWRLVDGCRLPLWPPGSDDLDAWGRVPVAAQPALRRVAHGHPGRVDSAERPARLHALGNAVVPAAAEVVGRLVLAAEHERLRALADLEAIDTAHELRDAASDRVAREGAR